MLVPRMTGDPTTSREAVALLYEVPDAVIVVGRDERVLLVNAAAARMFGVSGDALVCDVLDVTRLARANAALAPPLAQGCAAALP